MLEITGGYYMKARCVQESDISSAPPHVREIWDWLLLNANYSDQKASGKVITRGQQLTSYKEILDGLSWYVGYRKCSYSKGQCEIAMKWLTKREMIATTKTTRGMIITICNYSRFQDYKNYESYTGNHNGTTMEPQGHDRIRKEGKESKKETIEPLADFKCFYEAYPKKKSRGQAEKTWNKLSPTNDLLKEILTGLESAKKSEDWTKDNGKYIPHPSTWLNAKGWEDEIVEARDYEVTVNGEPQFMTEAEYKQWRADSGR